MTIRKCELHGTFAGDYCTSCAWRDRAARAEARVAELEVAIHRCLETGAEHDFFTWVGFAELQSVVHDGIPAPRSETALHPGARVCRTEDCGEIVTRDGHGWHVRWADGTGTTVRAESLVRVTGSKDHG